MHLMQRFTYVLAVVLCAPSAYAEEPALEEKPPETAAESPAAVSPPRKQLNFDDILSYANMEVTVASKVREKVSEAPAVVTALPRSYIDDFRWRSINDVLTHQPGFSLSRDFERDTISMRGIFQSYTNNRLLLLLDGVQQSDTTNGSAFTWEVTPLFMTKALEVIRGPGSALYGTSAMQGVVAMNTVSAEDLPYSGAARLTFGSRSTQIWDAVAGMRGKYFSGIVGINFYLTNGNGYFSRDISGRTDTDGSLSQFLVRDHRESRYLFAKLDGEGLLKGLRLEFQDGAWSTNTNNGWFFVIPDGEGPMHYSRRSLSAQYRFTTGELSQEYILSYGRTTRDWFPRFYPNGNSGYAAGEFEYLNNYVDDLFARGQLTYDFGQGATVLGGVELQNMFYPGDLEHYSNVAINDPAQPQTVNGAFDTLGPHYAPIRNNPFLRTGVFAQGSSGKLLGEMLALTVGVRYDNTYFQYATGTGDTKSRTIEQVSPRGAIVFTPTPAVTLKAMGSHAFRAPTITELAGSNSNIDTGNLEIEPETVTTYELTGEWNINDIALWKANFFYTLFDNAIAFSPVKNTDANMYSSKTGGVETEVNVRLEAFTVYGNYSYSQRFAETSQAPGFIAADPNHITWTPAHLANLGVNYKIDKFNLMVQGHLQGETRRRSSDLGNATYNAYRPTTVEAWATLDAAVGYQATDFLNLEVRGTNLSDSGGHMIAIHPRPFDYRIEGRRVFGSLTFSY